MPRISFFPGRSLLLLGIGLMAGIAPVRAQAERYEELKLQAAQYYSEKSYQLAYETWSKAQELGVPPADRLTLDFYLADSLWRSRPGPELLATARRQLQALAENPDAGNLSSEAWESLGDSWLAIENNWKQAWENYERALTAWAASTDLDRARPRYLGIVWKATGPPGDDYRVRQIPVDVLSNALEIATKSEDKARAHFFLGVRFLNSDDAYSRQRAGQEFKAAVEGGKGTAVYENGLFNLGEWQLGEGRADWSEDGKLMLVPDYDAALATFREFVRQFPEGSSALTAVANRRISAITKSVIRLQVPHQYLPGDRPSVVAAWRNVGEITFRVIPVDLGAAFQPTPQTDPDEWLSAVKLPGVPALREWKEVGGESRTPMDRTFRLDPIAEPGTYLVEATAGSVTARELIVVTSAAAILQPAGSKAVAAVFDARTGDRITEDVKLKIWSAQRAANGIWDWKSAESPPGKDGLHQTDLPSAGAWARLFVFANAGAMPAVVRDTVGSSIREGDDWAIQVFTDRAAYRPGDTVRWKLIARVTSAGVMRTPAAELINFRILDPEGDPISEGEVKLTEFGGGWGRLDLTKSMPLGEYSVEFEQGDRWLGEETLFRLEEYRIPEFKVGVEINSNGGIRLGEAFEAAVNAEYYFGGAVADADVEVVVREESHVRPFPFEYVPDEGAGYGKVVLNEKLRTGPDGRATFRVNTPFDADNDLRYFIEARVVDSSGREVIGTGSIVVARQTYFVELKSERRIALPDESVDISIIARDDNDRRVQTEGTLVVERLKWREVWKNPQGQEVNGSELAGLRQGVFPPHGEAGWRPVHEEYEPEEVARVAIETNADGTASYTFKPDAAGYYRISWSSPDRDGPPVQAKTHVWVSSEADALVGYHSGGLEIIVDPSAPAEGGQVPVLIAADGPNRDVLFAIRAKGELLHSELLHLDGDSRLLVLESEERYVPGIELSVAAVRSLHFFSDTAKIKFPPFRNTLSVELTPSAARAVPGEDVRLDMQVTDWQGRPARGEFAIGVTDQAISYIQGDYVGDPVEFFLDRTYYPYSVPVSSISGLSFYDEVLEYENDKKEARDGDRKGRREPSLAARMLGESGEDVLYEMAVVEEEAPANIQVRSNFAATAFWQPGVLTGADGRASISFRYPDSLTTWRAVARGATKGNAFGTAEVSTTTTKPLIARLQVPRFLVAGDSVTASGVVNNRTDRELDTRIDLHVVGLNGTPKPQTAGVDPNGDFRVAWDLEAPQVGEAKLTLTAVSGDLNDGMALNVPVVENGVHKTVSVAGKATGANTTFDLDIPAGRRKGSESLVITATPSLAAAALDALPYLISYPYGCVEQTMSRFLPAAVTLRTLQDSGLDRKAIANRMFGGVEPQFLSMTHPAMEGDAGMDELNAVVTTSLNRLYDFQHDDGAWGWWKQDEDDAFMTAYVLWGLKLAQESGVGVKAEVVERARLWVRLHLGEAANNLNLQAWLLHAVAVQGLADGERSNEEKAAIENLWAKRDQLSAFGRALFALAVHAYGDAEKAETLARNLRDGVIRDEEPGLSQATGTGAANSEAMATAHWGSDGGFRNWADSGVEATAFALRALLKINPKDDLVEPAMNWLVKNRRGAQWSNTRDTAITVLAMDAWLKASGELDAEVGFRIEVNGNPVAQVPEATALDGQSRFRIDRGLLADGANQIRIVRTAGDSPIYVSAQAGYFTTEEPIPAAGNDVFVARDYFLYAPKLTLLDGYRFDRGVWAPNVSAETNQRIEAVVRIEAKNDLQYLVFEDLKPAGLEAVDVQSGETMMAEGADGALVPVYCELRDRKIAFFIRNLPQGVWRIRYDLRAETAGNFSALPVLGHAMYVPEIRCNSESRRVVIIDAKR